LAISIAQQIRYVAPRPEAVPDLMVGWASMTERLQESPIDPVIAAAVSAFSFAFTRPFENGNGRLQRYLIQAMLTQRTFGLPGMVYPISAAISRDQHAYAGALRVFSDALLPLIQWHWTSDDTIAVENDTDDLYRYFDLTPFAEYLYDRVVDSVRVDLRTELDFVAVYQRAFEGVRNVVDMPDRRVSVLVNYCIKNAGKLPFDKRGQFPELSDAEIGAMEQAVMAAMGSGAGDGDSTHGD
jgi:Fic family protein